MSKNKGSIITVYNFYACNEYGHSSACYTVEKCHTTTEWIVYDESRTTRTCVVSRHKKMSEAIAEAKRQCQASL